MGSVSFELIDRMVYRISPFKGHLVLRVDVGSGIRGYRAPGILAGNSRLCLVFGARAVFGRYRTRVVRHKAGASALFAEQWQGSWGSSASESSSGSP